MWRSRFLSAILCALAAAAALPGEDKGPSDARPGDAAQDRAVRPSRTSAQSASRASEELLAVQKRTRDVRARALADRQAHEDRLKDLVAEKRYVERTVAVLKEEIAKREKDLKEKRGKLEADEAATEKLKGPSESILDSVKGYLDRLETRISSGIPWKIEERKRSVAQVREVVAGKDSSPATALGAAGRIQQEEESLARLVEGGTVEVNLGKESRGVQAFHLGHLAVIFSSEDGTVLGFAEAGQKLEDGLDAALGNARAADGYMAAIDILRRRRTPSLIDLYLPSFPLRKEGEAK